MAVAAVLGVFVAIPIISAYAFWFLVAAMIVWFGVHSVKKPGLLTMTPITLLVVAVVGVFVEVPIVSATPFGFWYSPISSKLASPDEGPGQ
jgi:hypothetical protein